MRSSMPPWPGSIAPESLTPAPRLIADSTRSPTWAATFNTTASASQRASGPGVMERAGQSTRAQGHQHRRDEQAAGKRSGTSLPALIRADARRKLVAARSCDRHKGRPCRRSTRRRTGRPTAKGHPAAPKPTGGSPGRGRCRSGRKPKRRYPAARGPAASENCRRQASTRLHRPIAGMIERGTAECRGKENRDRNQDQDRGGYAIRRNRQWRGIPTRRVLLPMLSITTTKGKDPFNRSSRTKGMRTAAVMTRFMISEKDTR